MAHRVWVRPASGEAEVQWGVQVVGRWTDSKRTQGSGLRAGQAQSRQCSSWAVNGGQEQVATPSGSGHLVNLPTGCVQVQTRSRRHVHMFMGVPLCTRHTYVPVGLCVLVQNWAWAQKHHQVGARGRC